MNTSDFFLLYQKVNSLCRISEFKFLFQYFQNVNVTGMPFRKNVYYDDRN